MEDEVTRETGEAGPSSSPVRPVLAYSAARAEQQCHDEEQPSDTVLIAELEPVHGARIAHHDRRRDERFPRWLLCCGFFDEPELGLTE